MYRDIQEITLTMQMQIHFGLVQMLRSLGQEPHYSDPPGTTHSPLASSATRRFFSS